MSPAQSTSSHIDRELAAAAIRKRQRGEKPTRDELAALRRVEKAREEELRWQYYSSIPQKHWREMSGRQTKVINEQSSRYGIPFGGRLVDLPAVVRALHNFLAENAVRLARCDQNGDSDALERLRRAKAEMAELERDRILGKSVDLEQHRMTIESVARAFKVEAASLPNHMSEAAVAALAKAGVEPGDPGAVLAEIKASLQSELDEYLRRTAQALRGLIE